MNLKHKVAKVAISAAMAAATLFLATAAQASLAGRENWRYTLFREAAPGDVVFHYDGRIANGIVGWSRIAGPSEPSPIIWKARGSYARERGAVPEELPGYRVPERVNDFDTAGFRI